MVEMVKTLLAYKVKNFLWGEIFYRIFTGLLGTLLVVLFLSGFMPIMATVPYLPWIIGFSAMVNGYSLVEKAAGRIQRQKTAGAGAGFFMAVMSCLSLNLLTGYMAGVGLIYWYDMLFFVSIGSVCGFWGALLSVKYTAIKNSKAN